MEIMRKSTKGNAVNRIAAAISKISSFSRFKRVFVHAKKEMLNVLEECSEQNCGQKQFGNIIN